MTTFGAQSYLEHYLEPLAPFLDRPGVTDIYVNQPGEIWTETLAGEIERVHLPVLDDAYLWRLSRQVASQSHQGISRRFPLLAAQLPGGARIQIAAPPATRWGLAMAIRQHAAAAPPLHSYAAPAPEAGTGRHRTDDLSALEHLRTRGDYPGLLADAVRRRLNIVISGGTSAGKTTLLNSLLAEIPLSERLLYIEDTPELRRSHENSVGLIAVRGGEGEAQVTTNDLLEAALRMRPDRIILGELRGPEAFTFLRAINTGHPGSLTTVHADDPAKALVQLAMMVLQAGLGLAYTDTYQLVVSMVDIVVQVQRYEGRRIISDILLP